MDRSAETVQQQLNVYAPTCLDIWLNEPRNAPESRAPRQPAAPVVSRVDPGTRLQRQSALGVHLREAKRLVAIRERVDRRHEEGTGGPQGPPERRYVRRAGPHRLQRPVAGDRHRPHPEDHQRRLHGMVAPADQHLPPAAGGPRTTWTKRTPAPTWSATRDSSPVPTSSSLRAAGWSMPGWVKSCR